MTDADAIGMYLNVKRNACTSATMIAYEKELRRWYVFVCFRKKTLATINQEDVLAFFSLLKNPPRNWLRQRGKEPECWTQLLYGPLTEDSITYSRRVISKLFDWLVKVAYVDFNPFELAEMPRKPKSESERGFGEREWGFIEDLVGVLNPRERWQILLAYHSGMRVSELAKAKMGDFVLSSNEKIGEFWWIEVTGKGRKKRRITCNRTLINELVIFRRSLDLPDFPSIGEDTPLIPKEQGKKTGKRLFFFMTIRGVQRSYERLFSLMASKVEDDRTRAKLMAATTHGLRHTFASHRLIAGADMFNTMEEMGHANVQTLHGYVHTQMTERVLDSRKTER